jgi:N-acetylglucosamine-6-sulfatase
VTRPFALIVAAALAVGALAGCSPSSGSGLPKLDSDRPNIVFVLTDDLSMNLISHMPQVQAMQKSGTSLSDYHVVDSLCCPSRSAIFTGEYPHDDGVFTNSGSDGGYNAYNKNGDEKNAFALALQKQGYETGFMGKYLNGYQPKDKIPPGWNQWDVAGNGYPEFNYDLNENGKVQHYGKDPQDYLVDVLSSKAGSFIGSEAGKKPFMLEVATFAPHAPYTPAPRYADAAKDVSYPRTPAYDTLPTNPPSWLKQRPPLTVTQEQNLTSSYQKRVEADLAVNDLIGHIRQELQAKGVANNTYLVFSSDNGYHMGEYRLLAGKQTAFDTDTHVPFVVTGPGVPAGKSLSQLTSNIDIAPTFEAWAGATIGSHVDGLSMAGLLHQQTASGWPQAILIEHHGPNDKKGDPDRQNAEHADPPSYEALRTADGLYVRYSSGAEEYYNTETDPYELHNLGPEGVPSALRTTLSHMENCHDATACRAAAQL